VPGQLNPHENITSKVIITTSNIIYNTVPREQCPPHVSKRSRSSVTAGKQRVSCIHLLNL